MILLNTEKPLNDDHKCAHTLSNWYQHLPGQKHLQSSLLLIVAQHLSVKPRNDIDKQEIKLVTYITSLI